MSVRCIPTREGKSGFYLQFMYQGRYVRGLDRFHSRREALMDESKNRKFQLSPSKISLGELIGRHQNYTEPQQQSHRWVWEKRNLLE